MSLSGKRRFTFTWKIQNFSMCPHKICEGIKSPEFVVDMLKTSEWHLYLCPKIGVNEGSASCFLRYNGVGTTVGGYTGNISIGYSITLYSDDISKRITKEVERKSFLIKTYESPLLISRQVIFEDKVAYLPNDTLTLQCSLWDPDAFEDVVKKEVLATNSRDNIQYSGLLDSEGCSVVSRLQVQWKTVSWPIRNFSSIIPYKRITMLVHSVLKDEPSFFLTLYKTIHNQIVEIEIKKGKTQFSRRTCVKCKVSVVHAPKSSGCFAVGEHLFEADIDNAWKFPPFIQFNKLQENKYLDRTHDVLYLLFEIAFSQLGDLGVVHHVVKGSSRKFGSFIKIPPPIDEFGHLYREGEPSDITIRTGNREFKVHKVILKAGSSVFSAMFENFMKEKETAVVDITDVDSDTMDRMLGFMYTNAVEDVQTVDAAKLYSAADKYQILPLKLRCSWILASTLSVSNVCDVLRLADLHYDESWYYSVEGFIHANSDEIFKSREWKDLIKSNGTLAAKVMHDMLVNCVQ